MRPARLRRKAGAADAKRTEPADRHALVHGDLPWTGDEGYKKAEVTGGGVALSEIDPRTMESRRHPRPVSVRRNAGRVRPDWRLQFSLGLGHGPRRRGRGGVEMICSWMSLTTRMLIVEDHADSAEFLRLLLEPQGYVVHTAVNAQRGARRADRLEA